MGIWRVCSCNREQQRDVIDIEAERRSKIAGIQATFERARKQECANQLALVEHVLQAQHTCVKGGNLSSMHGDATNTTSRDKRCEQPQ